MPDMLESEIPDQRDTEVYAVRGWSRSGYLVRSKSGDTVFRSTLYGRRHSMKNKGAYPRSAFRYAVATPELSHPQLDICEFNLHSEIFH